MNTKTSNSFSSQVITYINDIKLIKNNKEFPKFEYEGAHGFSGVLFHLSKNEGIRSEAGTMNYMTNDIKINTTHGNNIFKGIGRMFSGTSFFYNIFYNDGDKISDIAFSSAGLGDIGCFYIPPGETLYLISHSYVCSTLNLEVESGIKIGGIMTGYGLVFVSVKAKETAGLVWINSFGSIRPITLKPTEKVKVDNGILLGFPSYIKMNTKPVGGIKSTLLSGEALVTEILNNTNKDITIYTHGKNRSTFNASICNKCIKGKPKVSLFGGTKKRKSSIKKNKK